ncbi:hypothetical protein KSP40_PGU017932 [Platanthera guangdongensis]|uniref:Uncharacterized protein n=1 Tax=Platanthera guangdongensis TaxID=2320717 RepID=A0ABR2MRT6_9ASPA
MLQYGNHSSIFYFRAPSPELPCSYSALFLLLLLLLLPMKDSPRRPVLVIEVVASSVCLQDLRVSSPLFSSLAGMLLSPSPNPLPSLFRAVAGEILGQPNPMDGIQPAVKAALTRAYKQGSSSRVVRTADYINPPGMNKALKKRIAAILEPVENNIAECFLL